MQIVQDEDNIYLEPIKKKPKIAPVTKSKMPLQPPPNQFPQIPFRHLPDLKAQAMLLESLKFNEDVIPDTVQSSLKSDYTEWTHSDFLFKVNLQNNTIQQDFAERMKQYFRDFNQKCKIYPYWHFIDLKPDTNHKVTKGLPISYQNNESSEDAPPPKIIPLNEIPKVIQKIKIIKIESK